MFALHSYSASAHKHASQETEKEASPTACPLSRHDFSIPTKLLLSLLSLPDQSNDPFGNHQPSVPFKGCDDVSDRLIAELQSFSVIFQTAEPRECVANLHSVKKFVYSSPCTVLKNWSRLDRISPPDVQQLIFDRREFQNRPLAIFFVHLLRYEVDDFTTSFWV